MNTPRVDVVADLVVEVDGTPVTVTADGTEVLVSVADPDTVLAAAAALPHVVGLRPRGVRRGVGTWADRAAAAGLDVVVTGPDGVLLTVGRSARPSRAVRLVAGTDSVALGSWSALRGPLAGLARRRLTHAAGRLRRRG